MKVIGFLIGLLFAISIFSIDVSAQEGCCSSHGGVCGCGCCDGSAFSEICDDYYPQCYGNVTSNSGNGSLMNGSAGGISGPRDNCDEGVVGEEFCSGNELKFNYQLPDCRIVERVKDVCENKCEGNKCIEIEEEDNEKFFSEGMIVMIALGFLGGLARALFGVSKAVSRGEKVVPWYFVVTLIVSAILGALMSYLTNMDYKAAAIVGYVGTDILENVAASVVPKKLLWGGR